ncbi:hypothetical protein Q3G72_018804 [Acer saccharum]|nr:hypothetical protein Q3G72_018804 [Acer saccharum]
MSLLGIVDRDQGFFVNFVEQYKVFWTTQCIFSLQVYFVGQELNLWEMSVGLVEENSAVVLATLAVILLALFSPVAHNKKPQSKSHSRPWLALSLYIQQPNIPPSPPYTTNPPTQSAADAGAFVFHRTLTEGPENTSRPVGKAQGFIVPIEHFANSAFNIVYLTFDAPEFSGSLSVEAKHVEHKNREELKVVGGTGSFAFARGLAVFAQTDNHTYHVKLQLRFPNRSQTIPG